MSRCLRVLFASLSFIGSAVTIVSSLALFQEEECRNSLDPKYSHLSDDLHVEISAMAPPAEAHARIAFALAEIRKYMVPDSNDEIRQVSSLHVLQKRKFWKCACLYGLPSFNVAFSLV